MILNPQLLIEVSKCIIVELLSIVRNKDFKDSKATNDALPDKALDVLLSDYGQGF